MIGPVDSVSTAFFCNRFCLLSVTGFVYRPEKLLLALDGACSDLRAGAQGDEKYCPLSKSVDCVRTRHAWNLCRLPLTSNKLELGLPEHAPLSVRCAE